MVEGKTIRRIRAAVHQGSLPKSFTPEQVKALGIHPKTASNFLPKHCVGNPGGNTELFVRLSSRPAIYRLND